MVIEHIIYIMNTFFNGSLTNCFKKNNYLYCDGVIKLLFASTGGKKKHERK